MSEFSFNPFRELPTRWSKETAGIFTDPDIPAVHRSLPEYRPTPLVDLPALARRLGVRQILVKDEAMRFGLKAFKALGATYAIYRFLNRGRTSRGESPLAAADFYRRKHPIPPLTFTFCTATDGNHGRGVAWVARKLRQHAVIFMPKNSVAARIDKIKAENADVIIVDGTYDDAVAMAAEQAEKNGWQIISDTSWPGYMDIPRWIMAGYTTMFGEIHERQIRNSKVDFVFVQGGVGALGAAAAWYYNRPGHQPEAQLVSVEPTEADCLLESIRSSNGSPRSCRGGQNSIMAGLNCGTPSLVAWPMIKAGFDLFMTVSDEAACEAMRSYYYPLENDPRIVSGESGAAGLAALLSLCSDDSSASARANLPLSPQSTILLINTEGDSDPAAFRAIIRR